MMELKTKKCSGSQVLEGSKDLIVEQASKILSNLKHLNPTTTTDLELEIIQKAKFEISKLDIMLIDGNSNCYGIYFLLPNDFYNSIRASIPSVEDHLKVKAGVIFKFFPGSKLLELKILNLSQQE